MTILHPLRLAPRIIANFIMTGGDMGMSERRQYLQSLESEVADQDLDFVRFPYQEFQSQSPRDEAKLTSMPKRNRGSGTKTQIKMRRYKPAIPGECKRNYFYDSRSRMCVLKSSR